MPTQTQLPIGKQIDLQSIELALFGPQVKSTVSEAVSHLAAHWSTFGQPGSMPVAIVAGVLQVECVSPSAKQTMMLKFPAIQREIKNKFGVSLEKIHFVLPDQVMKTEKSELKKIKTNESEHQPTDIEDTGSQFIQDIRKVLEL